MSDWLCQYQTLNPPRARSMAAYSGADVLSFDPYDMFPPISLEERYASFKRRLAEKLKALAA